jgi:DNA-binding NtrC family response regulator
LLVDDDPSFRLGLSGALGDDGHEVFAFASPGEVPQDGRLLDVTLGAPVVLVTAYLTFALDAEAAARPFLTALSKPVDYDQFHSCFTSSSPRPRSPRA